MVDLRVSRHAVDRFIERTGFLGTRDAAHAEIVARIGRAIMAGVKLGPSFEILIGGARFVVVDGHVVTTKTAEMGIGRTRRRIRLRDRRRLARERIEVEA